MRNKLKRTETLLLVFILGLGLGAFGYFGFQKISTGKKTPMDESPLPVTEELTSEMEPTEPDKPEDSRDELYLEKYQRALSLLEHEEITLGISTLKGLPTDYRNAGILLNDYDKLFKWCGFYRSTFQVEKEWHDAGIEFRLIIVDEELRLLVRRLETNLEAGIVKEEETFELSASDIEESALVTPYYRWIPTQEGSKQIREHVYGAIHVFGKVNEQSYQTYYDWKISVKANFAPDPTGPDAMAVFQDSHVSLYSIEKPWTAANGIEVPVWDQWNSDFIHGFDSSSADRTKSFLWMGEEKTENYLYSKVHIGDSYEIDYYGDGVNEEWGIHHDTGQVVIYHRFSHDQTDAELSQEELESICQNLAAEYINPVEYHLLEDSLHEYSEGFAMSWQRNIDDPEAGISASVFAYFYLEIGMDGTIWTMEAHMLDEFETYLRETPEQKILSEMRILYSETFEQALWRMLNVAYPGHDINLFSITRGFRYPWAPSYLTCLDDGRLGLVICVYIDGPEDQYDEPDLMFLFTGQ